MNMKKRIKNKIRTRKGFTLAEMLIAVLIMLMVSGIVAAGIPAAKNAYEGVVIASNADILLSTTISALRNELGTARNIETASDKTVTYFSSSRNAYSRLSVDAQDGIMLQRYAAVNDMGTDSDPERLVSKAASTNNLLVTYESADYSDGFVTFKNLVVMRGTDELTEERDVSVRVISG